LQHNTGLMTLIASTLGVTVEQIHSLELSLCDTQDAVIGGLNNEFIFSGRLDNLCSSYCATEALREASTPARLALQENIQMIALFDHEECGSSSAIGALSPLLSDSIVRICTALHSEADLLTSKANSFCISSDMAHAVHPNWSDKHEKHHRPEMNKGLVVKTNVNQSYATTSSTSLVIEALSAKYHLPIQRFCIRNDAACGSTIGPLCARTLGVRTVDIGAPQLSMHSIREVSGVVDVTHAINLFKGFFEHFPELNRSINFD